FYCTGDFRDFHSFPTRRSSDLNFIAWTLGYSLATRHFAEHAVARERRETLWPRHFRHEGGGRDNDSCARDVAEDARMVAAAGDRSEEHTSELQSRFELVCRLLL